MNTNKISRITFVRWILQTVAIFPTVLRLARDQSQEDCLISLCPMLVSLRDIGDQFEAPLLSSPSTDPRIRRYTSRTMHRPVMTSPGIVCVSPRRSSRARIPVCHRRARRQMCEAHVHETWSRWRIVSRRVAVNAFYASTCVVYLYGYTNGERPLTWAHGFQRRGRFTPRCASSPGIRVQCHVGNDTIGHAPIRVP